MHKRIIKEEPIRKIRKPGGHVTSACGTGVKIAATIFEHLQKNNVDMSQFVAIGCDDMATNIGWKNGAIHNI